MFNVCINAFLCFYINDLFWAKVEKDRGNRLCGINCFERAEIGEKLNQDCLKDTACSRSGTNICSIMFRCISVLPLNEIMGYKKMQAGFFV